MSFKGIVIYLQESAAFQRLRYGSFLVLQMMLTSNDMTQTIDFQNEAQ